MSFEAWHGSRYGECFFMRGHEKPVAWFSFISNRSDAEYFAKLAWKHENRLPTLCRVCVLDSEERLFDAGSALDDPTTATKFIDCLRSKGVSEYWMKDILSSLRHYDYTAFDPNGGGTDSHLVAQCLEELGYIGWLERESHLDEPQNFGLFDPGLRVEVLEEIKLCPECGQYLNKVEESVSTFECGICERAYKECGDCGESLEYDEENDIWTYPCDCDYRDNPSEQCRHRYFDLRDIFSPNLHKMQYDLSSAVGAAFESKKNSALRRISARDFDIFGLVDVPKNPIYFQSALQEKIEFDCETKEDVLEIAKKMREHLVFRHFIPPYFGYTDVRMIENPFWFVHFTSRDKALAIQESGFVGREDPEALFSTKHGIHSEITDNGYLFAYLLKAKDLKSAEAEVVQTFEEFFKEKEETYFDDPEYPYNIVSPHYVIANADFGIDAFHTMDDERQVIVPTLCVDTTTIHASVDQFNEFGIEYWGEEEDSRDNPYPLYTDCDEAFQALKQYFEEHRIPKEIENFGRPLTEFLTDVPFVHNLQVNEGEDAYALTRSADLLLGKVTPGRLFHSYHLDAYARGNGYLFCYDSSEEGVIARASRYYIEGRASHAVRFFHWGDSEFQLIVPIKCITSMETKSRGDSASVHLDPLSEAGMGISRRTGVRPRHLMGGIIGELQPLCPKCQTHFSDVDISSPTELAKYPMNWDSDPFRTGDTSSIMVCGKCKGEPNWKDRNLEKEVLVITPESTYTKRFTYFTEIKYLLNPSDPNNDSEIEVIRSLEDASIGFAYDFSSTYYSSPVNNNPHLPSYIRSVGVRGAVVVGDYESLLWTPHSQEEF